MKNGAVGVSSAGYGNLSLECEGYMYRFLRRVDDASVDRLGVVGGGCDFGFGWW